MKKEIIQLLSKLISYHSTADNKEAKKMIVGFVEKWLKNQGIKSKLYNHPQSPSIFVTLPGKVKKIILVAVHLDVVPCEDRLFKPKLKGDNLYGRGAIDNKGLAAISMIMARLIRNDMNRPSVKILFTTDEEVGGENGVGRLVKLGVFKNIAAVFIPDDGAISTSI